MLNLTKQTSCGRFIVRIESRVPPSATLTVEEGVRSLQELSELLFTAAGLAAQLALQMLDGEAAK